MKELGLAYPHGSDNRAGVVLKACASVLKDGKSGMLGP